MDHIPFILSIIPFLIFLFLLLVRKETLLNSSIITLILYTILGLFYWKIIPSYLYFSYAKGLMVGLDIFMIIFGAIFFLEILKDLKVIHNISYYLGNLSGDYRVQIIIIAWFLECFIESTAGFGTPAAIAVPILMGLGLPPIKALIIGLLGNSIPGVFGAVGTPIKVGFAGLNVANVPYIAALLNTVGFIIPVFMLWILTSGRENRRKEFWDGLPFAIMSGLAFVIPSLLSVHLGQEFPSIIGSIVGLFIMIAFIKLRLFIPKEELKLDNSEISTGPTMSKIKSFLPYIILVSLLIAGKFIIGGLNIPINIGLTHKFSLFNPGFVFIISGILILFIFKEKLNIIRTIKKSFNGAIYPFIVVSSMLAMVQIMINSGHNTTNLPSAITLIALNFETSWLPFFTPFMSAFGALMTGSVTVSNIMFGNLFNIAANNLNIYPSALLALGVVGAGIGNMIALADILTAEAVTGVKNSERQVLKGVMVPCLISLSIVGLIGVIIFG